MLLAPGFDGDTRDLAVDLLRIMFPGIGFLVLSAWCLGILNSHRRFFLSYVAPVLWNAAQIALVVAAGLWGASREGIAIALAWGVLVGGRSEEHTSELQSLMRISYAVFCLKTKNQ